MTPRPPGVDCHALICDEPTHRYRVQVSDDLIAWSDLTELYADPDGRIFVKETFPQMPPRRFYRLQRIIFPDTP